MYAVAKYYWEQVNRGWKSYVRLPLEIGREIDLSKTGWLENSLKQFGRYDKKNMDYENNERNGP
jgi:hypothetical protein